MRGPTSGRPALLSIRQSTNTVKALVKLAPGEGHLDVVDVEEPRCAADRVKIEVAFCGVCGTDLHILHGTFRSYPP